MKITKKLLVVFIMIFVRGVALQTDTSPDIKKVEKSLLSALGLRQRPVVDRKKAQIPQAMFNLYQKKINHDSLSLPLPGRLTRSANTVRSYTHEESSIDEKFLHNHRFRLSFNLTAFPENEIITSAELKLSLKVPNECVDCSHQRISIYDIVQPGIKNITKPILRIVDTKLVLNNTLSSSSERRTVSLDVLPILERWLSSPQHNYGLLVDVKSLTGERVKTPHVRLKRSTGTSKDDEDSRKNWDTVQPVLLVYSDDKKTTANAANQGKSVDWAELARRQRRSAERKHRKRQDDCSRRSLWVDFDKVGWNDWIVAPPGYDAFYCAGNCPQTLDDHLNTTNHAIVQNLIHAIYPLQIPKPCCVPTKLSSVSLLYLDNKNQAVLKTYNDMVVEGCGCR